jgi:hypothetical protein
LDPNDVDSFSFAKLSRGCEASYFISNTSSVDPDFPAFNAADFLLEEHLFAYLKETYKLPCS